MDFLDPKKQRRHAILLYAGYFLIGIAILISTLVLVYQANGFGVNSKGQVVQNGLVFFSSQPNPADIYLNGARNDTQTNARLSLPAGQYDVRLNREGYRSWQRQITVQGGDVQHFDYPFLFPSKLTTTTRDTLASAAGIASQSRDRRWLIVQRASTPTVMDLYDLKNPTVAPTALTLPAAAMRSVAGAQTWEVVQWADDNQHLLVRHTYANGSEFIVIDRNDVTKSVNLNATLGAEPLKLTLIDNKYDQYHLLDGAGVLSTATIGSPAPVRQIENVLAYKSYGSKTVLYVTSVGASDGKAMASMLSGDKTYPVREVAANTTYLLDMAGYRGEDYVALAASSENTIYIYRNPLGQLKDATVKKPVASRAMRITAPNYISFSNNTQYIAAQSGSQFGVYDIYLRRAYVYNVDHALDAPQQHAEWMDGNRLTYVSDGKVLVFDYDRRNQQTLQAANSGYGPYFSPDYRYSYAIVTGTTGATQLTQTALVTDADL